jgi:hypothetical protein
LWCPDVNARAIPETSLPQPDTPKLAACRAFICRVFCQVTGFSRPGNRDKHAHRLPAAPPGVMVVQTAGQTPGNNPE